MVPQRSLHSSQRRHDDLTMAQAWETNDYIDFMAAILLGVALTALALSVM
jgi:hypothetical protein